MNEIGNCVVERARKFNRKTKEDNSIRFLRKLEQDVKMLVK